MPAITRQALVCLPPPAADGNGARRVLGRWLGEWQVDHAADMGCTGLFILGGGGGEEAVATRLGAERQGLKVREIATPHALAGSVAPGEHLLVLQPQILPSAAPGDGGAWWQQATRHGLVLTFPAAAGVEAGFERIDLARAWAGALLMPGSTVHRLLDLPEDVEAAPALLRIALQAGVPELRLGEDLLASGAWPVLGRGVPVRLHEEKWLGQRLAADGPALTPSGRLCRLALRRWGAAVPGKPVALPATLGLSAVLSGGGIATAIYGAGEAGFALVALAALALEAAGAIATLQRGRAGLLRHLPKARWVIDAALLATGYLGIEGRWFRQLFPALVLVMGLNLAGPAEPRGWWRAALADRALVALAVAALSLAASPEVGVMLVAAALLAGAIAANARITRI